MSGLAADLSFCCKQAHEQCKLCRSIFIPARLTPAGASPPAPLTVVSSTARPALLPVAASEHSMIPRKALSYHQRQSQSPAGVQLGAGQGAR